MRPIPARFRSAATASAHRKRSPSGMQRRCLNPSFDQQKKRKLDIIAKVDCEGSEFWIFEQLDAHKLLPDIAAFMVEWHRGSGGKMQHDLIKPLRRHGFLVLDVSPKEGNGFFYAVRTSRSSPRSTSASWGWAKAAVATGSASIVASCSRRQISSTCVWLKMPRRG
jgi:hypothetical protein